MKIIALNLSDFNNYQKNIDKPEYRTHCEQNRSSFMSYPANYYISFGAKTPLELVKEIGISKFPSQKIFQKVLSAYKNDSKFSLYNAHLINYKDLLTCKTLEEAKKIFPELFGVIDAKDIKYSEMSHHLKRIKNGKSAVKIEDLSLELIKKYFGKAISINNTDEYYGMSVNTTRRMLKSLNFPFYDSKYARILYSQAPEKIQAASQKTSQFAKLHPEWGKGHSDFMKEYVKRPEIKQKMHKKNIDEDIKKRISEKVKDYNKKNPEKVKRHNEFLTQYYKDHPEARQVVSEKMIDFHRKHPEYAVLKSYIYTKLFPDYCKKMSKIAEEFPAIAGIRAKVDRGIKLTEGEIAYEKTFFARCRDEFPEINSQIGDIYKKLIKMFSLSKNCNSQEKLAEIEKVFSNEEKVKELINKYREIKL